MSIDFYVEEKKHSSLGARIKVIGVGGGGSNAVNSMVASDLEGIKFIIANTDVQALQFSPADMKIQIGKKITKGLGSGSNPDVGRRAAEEELQEILEVISDADILFLTAGMGGGTGTGATPVIARAAREMGVLTVAIVTKPFMFEGKRRAKQAEAALEILKKEVDTLIVIPNQKLLEQCDPKISLLDAFALVNNVLKQAIKGVSDIITKPGHINVDFADVRSIMKGMGMAIMGTGRAKGADRAKQAAFNAINSQLLEGVTIEGAQGVLINITGDNSLGLYEVNDAVRVIYDCAGEDANIIFGSVIDQSMGDEIMVTIIATGFEKALPAEGTKTIKHDNDIHSYQSPYRQDQSYVTMKRMQQTPSNESSASQTYKELHHSTQQASSSTAMRDEIMMRHTPKLEVDINDLDAPTYLRKKIQAETEGSTEL